MNLNAVADEVLKYLDTKHSRVYRNKSIQSPAFPYVVFSIESVTNTMPSEDLYLNVDIFDDAKQSVRVMEDLGDLIDNGLNNIVISTDLLNLHFVREQRQYVSGQELVTTQLVNIRYVIRAYFK